MGTVHESFSPLVTILGVQISFLTRQLIASCLVFGLAKDAENLFALEDYEGTHNAMRDKPRVKVNTIASITTCALLLVSPPMREPAFP